MRVHSSFTKVLSVLLALLLCLGLMACSDQADDEIVFASPDIHTPFGSDKSATAGDIDAAINALYKICHEQPETLAATMSAFPSRVEKLGLESADPNDLDDAMDAEDGGDVQWSLLEELKDLLEDPATGIVFSQWGGKARMLYMVRRDGSTKDTPRTLTLVWEYVELEDGDTIMEIVVPREDGSKDIGYFDMRYGFQRFEPYVEALTQNN